jgi:ABC-type dipeptide/oligopeptide/nickel transport system ATPase component
MPDALLELENSSARHCFSKRRRDAGATPLLEVDNLTVQYCPQGPPEIANVSFAIAPGEVVGLAGESGCGKTTLALSLLRLLPPSARVVTGSIRFRGQELLALSERQLEAIRGARISMVLQEPGIALHPMLPVGEQIADVLQGHNPWSRRRCREEATRMLLRVHLKNVGRIYAAYPHQLSGGQRQRVVIAQALACQPDLIVADEPTASLDSRTQVEILNVLRELRERSGTAMLLVSHNPAVLAMLADRVMVIHAGRIMEQSDIAANRPGREPDRVRLVPVCTGGGLAELELVPARRRPVERSSLRRSAEDVKKSDLTGWRTPSGVRFREPSRTFADLKVCASRFFHSFARVPA